MPRPDLSGLAILVVEDDYHLAEELYLGLQEFGARVLGPAPSVAEAMRVLALHPRPDAAVLDVNLNGEFSWPIVDALLARHVPVLLASGYDSSVFPPQYKQLPLCEKPFSTATLATGLLRRIAESADRALA